MNQYHRVLVIISLSVVCPALAAGDQLLLQGSIDSAEGLGSVRFELSGPSRERPEGGELRFAERVLTIDRISRHGMIGASGRFDGGAEYAIFSSSYSAQTAIGRPWVAADRYLGCERPYNSFLALHRIDDPAALAELESQAYAVLQDSADLAAESTVYCFVSKPPGR